MDKKGEWTCFVMADCTGHGIPGAFMTLISSTLLDRVKSMDDLSQPDLILNQLDKLLENKPTVSKIFFFLSNSLLNKVLSFSPSEKRANNMLHKKVKDSINIYLFFK